MADVLLCRDCRHFSGDQWARCTAPDNRLPFEPDYINGAEPPVKPHWYGAQYCREDAKTCGPTARWWEAK